MNINELSNKFEKTVMEFNEKLKEINKEIEAIKAKENEICKRQKPNFGETYYFLGDGGIIVSKQWHNTFDDIFRFDIGNCFKTEQEAEDYKENLLTKQALKDLAQELNNGVKICWENSQECKYYIFTHSVCGGLHTTSASNAQSMGEIYCLDKNFLDIAQNRIGEEKLIKLIKSGV